MRVIAPTVLFAGLIGFGLWGLAAAQTDTLSQPPAAAQKPAQGDAQTGAPQPQKQVPAPAQTAQPQALAPVPAVQPEAPTPVQATQPPPPAQAAQPQPLNQAPVTAPPPAQTAQPQAPAPVQTVQPQAPAPAQAAQPQPPAKAAQPQPQAQPQTQAAADPQDGGRYSFHRTGESFLRLDTRTGQLAQCGWSATGWSCKAVPDERAALESEIARLQRENAVLKKSLLARGLDLPGGVMAEAPPVPPASIPEAKPDSPARKPSEADLDRAIAYMKDVWRKLVDMMIDLQRDIQRKS